MEILTIAEKLTDISIRYMALEGQVASSEHCMQYSKVEGDEAYSQGDYKREKSSNRSYDFQRNIKERAMSELDVLRGELDEIHEEYYEALASLTVTEKQILLQAYAIKIQGMQVGFEQAIALDEDVRKKGDEAFNNNDFQTGKACNEVSSYARSEIRKIAPVLSFYISLYNDLSFRVTGSLANNMENKVAAYKRGYRL